MDTVKLCIQPPSSATPRRHDVTIGTLNNVYIHIKEAINARKLPRQNVRPDEVI